MNSSAPSSTNPPEIGSQSIIITKGAIGLESAKLLSGIVNSTPCAEDGNITRDPDGIPEGDAKLASKPNINVRRLLAIMPLLTIAATVTMAPKIEVYTLLACNVQRPDIFDLNRCPPEPPLSYIPVGHSPFYTGVPLQPTYQAQFTSTIATHNNNQSFDTIHDNVPQPNQQTRCASDPGVKAAVAKLTAVIGACTGLLMCITTGWWGSFSDRHGRKSVMIVSTLSLLITDVNFILALYFPKHVPGGYWFLLIGPIADGIFGGMTIGTIAIQSYIADATHESERSAAFSFALGLLFSGMALGPTFGSLLIHFSGSLLSVFYLSAVLHALYAICVEIIVPESLTLGQMDDFRLKYRAGSTSVATQDGQSLFVRVLARLKSFFAFLTPLTIFFPVHAKNGNPLRKAQRDWSLTIVIVGYGLTYCVVGSYSYKFQYAISTFGWSSEELGYWFSAIGASRAVYLALILPVIIKTFKPKPAIQSNIDVSTDLRSSGTIGEVSSSSSPLLPKATKKEAHSAMFDLNLAKYSLLLEIIAFAGMGLSRTSLPFSIFGAISALGAGFGPAAEATILILYTRRGDTEKGKLLGAVGVLQAICSQIIGPGVFGLIYMKTVAAHPRTVFLTTVTTVTAAFLLLNFVRLPEENDAEQDVTEGLEEQESSVGR